MKKLLPILLVLLLSACADTPAPETTAPASATAPPETDGPGEAVLFRSAAVEKAARKALETPAESLTSDMLDSVAELFVTMDSVDKISRVWDEKLPFPAENPVDASELAHFPNLEKLILVGFDNEQTLKP